jgi:uncharacterized membrane protein
VPRLASDVTRTYVGMAATMVPVMAVPFVLVALPGEVSFGRLAIVTYLITWAIGSFVSSALTVITFRRATGEQLENWLRATTPQAGKARLWYQLNGGGAASWAIMGSLIAVAAVLILAFTPALNRDSLLVYVGIAVVVGSLALTITAYAVQYAREKVTTGGLEFSKSPHPTFADYLYLSVQVSTTFSSSDVSIDSTPMRRLVTTHSLIAFTFNTVIVALLVSVLISAST